MQAYRGSLVRGDKLRLIPAVFSLPILAVVDGNVECSGLQPLFRTAHSMKTTESALQVFFALRLESLTNALKPGVELFLTDDFLFDVPPFI